MADQDSLSPDKLDKVMQFQEVTGCTDVCVCVAALTAADWEVESAVHQHLTRAVAGEAPVTAAVPEPESEVRRRNTDHSSSSSAPSAPPLEPEVQDIQQVHRRPTLRAEYRPAPTQPPSVVVGRGAGGGGSMMRRILDWGLFLGFSMPVRVFVHFPMRVGYWTLQSLFGLAYTLLYSTSAAPDPARDMVQFLGRYESCYPGVPRPSFYRGSYSQALSAAKTQLQFLLVYLHCDDHLNTEAFCRNVLSDSRVINYINNNNILFWACDVALPEGYRVSQALRENDYPYLALMVLRNTRMSVVARMEGTALLDPQHVVDTLRRCHDKSMPYITAARNSRLEREQAVALRQEQDTAYQVSLRADREKARKKVEEEQQVREKELQEKLREQQEKDRRVRMKNSIPEEPPADCPGALQLVVKLPHGERLERRFHVDHPLTALYCLIYTHEGAPDRFEVTTNFPRRVVPCLPPKEEPSSPSLPPLPSPPQQQQGSAAGDQTAEEREECLTFGQWGVAPRTVLFVKDLDA